MTLVSNIIAINSRSYWTIICFAYFPSIDALHKNTSKTFALTLKLFVLVNVSRIWFLSEKQCLRGEYTLK